MNERDALLVMNAVPGLGNRKLLKWLSRFSGAVELWRWLGSDAAESEISPGLLRAIRTFRVDEFLVEEERLVRRHDVTLITLPDASYPAALRDIEDRPVVLYVKGHPDFTMETSLGVVGSRRATVYGCSIAQRWSTELAECGITVISGLARGIDTSAHVGSLRGGGRTIAVLGSGLARIYPSENIALAGEVAGSGCVISEFPMMTPPLPYNFPRRNRIISGLSRAVFIVEAALKSGALITVDFALEQGKDVFALPGMVDTATSAGVHELIKQGAQMVTSVEDLMEALGITKTHAGMESGNVEPVDTDISLTPVERDLLERLADRPLHIDQMVDATLLQRSDLHAALLTLEMKKKIHPLPGQFYTVNQKPSCRHTS